MHKRSNKYLSKGFLLLIVLAIGVFTFSGCVGQEEETPETVTTTLPGTTVTQPGTTLTQPPTTKTIMPTTLTVTGPWSGAEMEGFMPVLEAFTAETGIGVDYNIFRAEDLATILPAQLAAQKAPADLIFMWAWWIKENSDHVLDLSDVIDLNEFTGVADQGSEGGKVYGAPYTGKLKPGFWYRLSFFEEHGLKVPTTWDEFVSLCESIQKIEGIDTPIASGDGVGWPLSDICEHFLLTFGGVELFEGLKDGSVKWTDPAVSDIFENRMVPLIEKGFFSEPKDWTLILENWWAGKHAMYFMGSWITGMVDDVDDLGVFPLPGAKAFVFAGPDFFFVPKYSKHIDEAKKLAEFISGKEGQSIQVKQGGHLATHLDVSLDNYPAVDKRVAQILEGAETVTDLDDTIGGEFQTNFWDQLKFLWVSPGDWETVVKNIQSKVPE